MVTRKGRPVNAGYHLAWSWLRPVNLGGLGGWFIIAAAIAALVAGLLALDHFARQQVHGWDRYTVLFSDIECTPPEGLGRREFLDQVQYLASFPEHLHNLEEGLAARLAQGFARHPLVERVRGLEIQPTGKIRVQLEYRSRSPR
jgi:hypothetical protein